ncbi:hypothetical protein ACFV3R_28465 [Streptomyces sp. NPDC059740]|uniref:hypothetical protein n=1 Tax=Streptomyces sp. NPDC059740 TaxID=3346926 RepID=UPI00364DDB5D
MPADPYRIIAAFLRAEAAREPRARDARPRPAGPRPTAVGAAGEPSTRQEGEPAGAGAPSGPAAAPRRSLFTGVRRLLSPTSTGAPVPTPRRRAEPPADVSGSLPASGPPCGPEARQEERSPHGEG